MTRYAVRQITNQPYGHLLANRNVWSRDGQWLLYDIRHDETVFTGNRIERVHVETGQVEVLYRSPGDAACGVPTCSPGDDRFVFIHGPEQQTEDWRYCAWHRYGVVGDLSNPGVTQILDARQLTPPFNAGALRGGTHLHMFCPDGQKIASTYEDHVLATATEAGNEANRRVIAVSYLGQPTRVPKTHPRNHDGCSFTVIVTDATESPQAGSSEFYKAYSEAWLDHERLVFMGDVASARTTTHSELFLVQLPAAPEPFDAWTQDLSLAGTTSTRPRAPTGTTVKRLTWTDADARPGLGGPRHWCVPSPDGQRVGCFRLDEQGRAQFWLLELPTQSFYQVTSHAFSASSAFTWHPAGTDVFYVADGSICRVNVSSGSFERLTPQLNASAGPTHHACVCSPQGDQVAFMQPVTVAGQSFTQLFVVPTGC